MAQSSSRIAARIESANAKVEALKLELVDAQARESFVDGQTYTIKTGKGETAALTEAVLVAHRVNEKGVTELRFTAGVGFDQRFFDVTAGRVVQPVETDEEGKEIVRKSSAKIAAQIEKLGADVVALAVDLAEAEAREHLEDNATYTIRIGKPGSKVEVQAILLGQGVDEKGRKRLKFFYGAGFDAEIVTLGSGAVVFPDTDEADPADAAEPVVDAE